MSTETKEAEMEYRMLGGTGLQVSLLGFGAMTLKDVEHAMELLSFVRNAGCNFFDNAEFYGQPRGTMETHFGEALKRLQQQDPKLWRRSDLVITTKLFWGGPGDWSPMASHGVNERGLSRKHLIEGINESLSRLQLDYVDIVYAHRYDPLTPMEEIVTGFTDIIRSGKALYWGTSQWSAQKITEAYWVARCYNLIPPVVEQTCYNMLQREQIESEYLPLYRAPYNLGTTIYSPLACGWLTGKYNKGIPADSRANDEIFKKFLATFGRDIKTDGVKKIRPVVQRLGCSEAVLALAWACKNSNVSVVLLGATKVSQLKENVKCLQMARRLTTDDMRELDELLENKPQLPMHFGRVVNKTI